MTAPYQLRLLASTNNDRGDLFTRLVSDLFYALGYDNLRFDVHKTGREIDIEGTHRREPRRVIAECKAHAKKMGGAELNKLLGALTRERGKGMPVTGYFVSLGGFSESGMEQELGTDEQHRIITLSASNVISELTDARILISLDEATERAGRCVEFAKLDDETTFEDAELLGHSLGYIWEIFYGRGKKRTHLALIHADGVPLAQSVAKEVVEADRECKGKLHELTYLAPPPTSPDRQALAQEAMEQYRRWLVAECGYIQLDGLPADTDLSALRMRLEKLFVPLKVQFTNKEQSQVAGVGDFLREHSRFSILAKPGGGKSTLLKRLAVAYAEPERQKESADGLPDRAWLPLFLRCRELRDRVNRPVRELLADLGRQAEMTEDQAGAFREQVDDALRSGQVLLLVDGLDEFADEGARTAFASHLRTFLAMFPNASLVVTSREAGYRQIAGVVASVCQQTTMASFDESDVHALCERWHAEVVGDNEAVRNESRALADTIWKNERIRALAENPLMLTTLLVVRRNVGELPTKRVKLYRAAVDVLIRTWNVEGFDALDEEETLARLSYIAVAMLKSGQQRVGRQQLLKLLRSAQKELEVELQFAEISPHQFIDRIEYRSSLLMQTGHEEIDGELQEVFEFRHLTFQEYLVARGLVEEQYPGRDDGQSLTELLQPHFTDAAWREVIPLAAVLADRNAAESLIKELTRICKSLTFGKVPYPYRKDPRDPHALLLHRCLLDEVQVTPGTLRTALCQTARLGNRASMGDFVNLRRGKFGSVFQHVTEQAFFGEAENWGHYSRAVADLAAESFFKGKEAYLSDDVVSNLECALQSDDRVQKGLAALAVMKFAFTIAITREREHLPTRPVLDSQFEVLRDRVAAILDPDDRSLALCVSWCLSWTGIALPNNRPDKRLIHSLFRLWRRSEFEELSRFAGWAFVVQPLLPRDAFVAADWGDCEPLFQPDRTADNSATADVPFVVAWYQGGGWNDAELLANLQRVLQQEGILKIFTRVVIVRILDALGDPGRRVIDEWKKNAKHREAPVNPEVRRILQLIDDEPDV